MVIVLTLNKQASPFGSQTAKSRHTGADKRQTHPAHLIPYQRKIPRKEGGPNATYINEDESLEQIDILLTKKPTETHNKDILDFESDDSKMATTDSDLDTQQPHSVGNKRIPAAIKSPSK